MRLSPLVSLFVGLITLSCTSLGNAQPRQALGLDAEELRVPQIKQQLPHLLHPFTTERIDALSAINSSMNEQAYLAHADAEGNRLWKEAVTWVQQQHWDDRPLYWSRLALRGELKQQSPQFRASPIQRRMALNAFELSSRGISDLAFTQHTDFKILLTGFDPFLLDRHIDQSNPSGLAALALDGKVIELNGKTAEIQTVMIPVRFEDFDDGLIESILSPYLSTNSVDLITTVSMGRSDFDLERFPGLNRSATAPGNRNILTGANAQNPITPQLESKPLQGPEFVEFSLPVEAMQRVIGRWEINDNHQVQTLEQGKFAANNLLELQGQTSVQGSGGGYLSNEISYRSIRLANLLGSTVPLGHIHTPRIAQYEADTARDIVAQIEAMLAQAITAL
ncbi:hypothetical protein [Ferrimonas aestuarii]|uniref:Pyrrolidone-carboxylate peptidase (N-terminal pyroglutamyl peptidase) n=1 Tax=Ferrimonas aestuarii TaxID=2569539 RepID=A0A4U1BL05_9GAMM|nr:hypothetical protein [Ferrimonas aestuarii]TKB53032.1 hypothetical protein FCL42_15230 [Ferrimonas aestuarii]